MLEIIQQNDWNKFTELTEQFEDLYFSRKYPDITVKKPEYNKACSFCVDEVFSEITFACHKPWLPNHYNHFKQFYPEVEILKNLQEVEDK